MADQLSPLTPGAFKVLTQYPTLGQMIAAMGSPPDWMAFNTERTDFSDDCGVTGWASFTMKSCLYVVFGKIVIVWFHFRGVSNDGTSTGTYFNVPFTSKDAGGCGCSTMISVMDNGTWCLYPGQAYLSKNSTLVTLYKDNQGNTWTGSGNKYAFGFLIYEMS